MDLLLISVVDLLADVLIELLIIIDNLLSNYSVECISAADGVDQFIDVLCYQTDECLIPLVADVLNLVVNICIQLVVNFRTVDNQVHNLVVSFSVVGNTLL